MLYISFLCVVNCKELRRGRRNNNIYYFHGRGTGEQDVLNAKETVKCEVALQQLRKLFFLSFQAVVSSHHLPL